MPKFAGKVIDGEEIQGEILAAYKEGQWTDQETGEVTPKLQLQLTVQNPESDFRLISWINLPINEDGDIGDIRTRSGMGCLLKDIKRLTGQDIPEGCEDLAAWVEKVFEGKLVKATKFDSYRYMGLDMSNYLKLQELVTATKKKAKSEPKSEPEPTGDDFGSEDEVYQYIAEKLIDAGVGKNDAKGLIRSDERLKDSEQFGGLARRAARVVETVIEKGLVAYDEGDDLIVEPA